MKKYILNALSGLHISTVQGAWDTVKINNVIGFSEGWGMKSVYKEMKEETEAILSEHKEAKEIFVGVAFSYAYIFVKMLNCTITMDAFYCM